MPPHNDNIHSEEMHRPSLIASSLLAEEDDMVPMREASRTSDETHALGASWRG
jgi:hypothetical protein